jgi:hypothetical protein
MSRGNPTLTEISFAMASSLRFRLLKLLARLRAFVSVRGCRLAFEQHPLPLTSAVLTTR